MFGNIAGWVENAFGKISSNEIIDSNKTDDGTDEDSRSNLADPDRIDTIKETKTGIDSKDSSDNMPDTAFNASKSFGSTLLKFGKVAKESVASTASILKTTVEHNLILGQFNREQEDFVNRKRTKGDSAVAPWEGMENFIKQEILKLSQDERNVLRCPPDGVEFQFDMESSMPVAKLMLKLDDNLQEIRFRLVPRVVSELNFWRNYFYRVSLIRQSATSDLSAGASAAEKSQSGLEFKETDNFDGSEEFVSDAFSGAAGVSIEDIRRQLCTDTEKADGAAWNEDAAEWEQELVRELQEYELVSKDGDKQLEDEDVEEGVLEQLEKEI